MPHCRGVRRLSCHQAARRARWLPSAWRLDQAAIGGLGPAASSVARTMPRSDSRPISQVKRAGYGHNMVITDQAAAPATPAVPAPPLPARLWPWMADRRADRAAPDLVDWALGG